MTEVRCRRCQTLPEITPEGGNVYFIAPIGLLLDKLQGALSEMGYQTERKDNCMICPTDNFLSFLEELSKRITLSLPELKDIRVLFLPYGESLSLSHLSYIRPLHVYISLLLEREYLDILSEGRLVAHFHPVIESKSLKVVGYECLIRGVKRDGSLMFPSEIFEIANKTDTLFFLDRACREACLKTAAEKGIYNKMIFINFTPTSIYDPRFCLQTTLRMAQELNLNRELLVFEVVETFKVSDVAHLKNVLNFYRSEGFKVALDDVGTGYATLELLVTLSPDIIKIDRAIIREIDRSQLNQSVFKALIQIAKDMGIKALAEGIEREEELNYVRDSVDLLQGFYFARPSPDPIA